MKDRKIQWISGGVAALLLAAFLLLLLFATRQDLFSSRQMEVFGGDWTGRRGRAAGEAGRASGRGGGIHEKDPGGCGRRFCGRVPHADAVRLGVCGGPAGL